MNDEQVIEYLRGRGRAVPPAGLTAEVMAAVDAAPASVSRFNAFLPAMAVAAGVAIITMLVLVLGPGPNVGPAPSGSANASPSATPATLGELEAAVTAATERLASAGAVRGSHTYEIEGYLASATWFDWRPNGDQVVVTRTDIDVSAPWWTDPDGEPLTVGERIGTEMWVLVGDALYRTEDDEWLVTDRDGVPAVRTWGTGMLAGEIPPTGGASDPGAETTAAHRAAPDGGEVWTLRISGEIATGTIEWTIDREGRLSSYVADGFDVGLTPTISVGRASTRAVIEFMPVENPDPIPQPDPDAAPDASAFGLPPGFPLDPGGSDGAVDYRAYVEDVLDILETYHWESASVDWAAVRAAALNGLPDAPEPPQAHQRILTAIQTFDTFGTHFVRPQDVPAGSDDPDEITLPEAERIGDLGYLRLPAYVGTDDDVLTQYVMRARHEMDRVYAEGAAIDGAASPASRPTPATCAWVVDLRAGTGRSAVPLIASVAGLLDEGQMITYRSALGDWWLERNDDGSVALIDERRSADLPSPTVASVLAGAAAQGRAAAALSALPLPTLTPGTPVAVLTSPITAGSGEQVALVLRQLSTVRTFGGVTSGTPQEVLILRLVDGAELRVPTAVPLVGDGSPLTDNLVPDEIVADTGTGADDPVLERAVEWLEDQDDCS